MRDQPKPTPSAVVAEVLSLFGARGQSRYGGEAVTQRDHALQAAFFAERHGAKPALIVAALLHDVGHLLHELPDDAPDHAIDDRHETLAAKWLSQRFGPAVVQPVRLHVEAKRYLCAADPDYARQLSAPSIQSLKLQGGPMTPDERDAFEALPCFAAAVALRRWDDAAKVVGLATPDLAHFCRYIEPASREIDP
jgi:phosphonate degradation associated HDIG domain protein